MILDSTILLLLSFSIFRFISTIDKIFSVFVIIFSSSFFYNQYIQFVKKNHCVFDYYFHCYQFFSLLSIESFVMVVFLPFIHSFTHTHNYYRIQNRLYRFFCFVWLFIEQHTQQGDHYHPFFPMLFFCSQSINKPTKQSCNHKQNKSGHSYCCYPKHFLNGKFLLFIIIIITFFPSNISRIEGIKLDNIRFPCCCCFHDPIQLQLTQFFRLIQSSQSLDMFSVFCFTESKINEMKNLLCFKKILVVFPLFFLIYPRNQI